MATAKQILANRANAAKSTGPKTPEGRARSSQNGLRHGALSRAILIKGESHHNFCRLLDRLHDEFEPQSAAECDEVQIMAVARWRQMRIWAIEKANLTLEIKKEAALDLPSEQSARTSAALAFRTLSEQSRSLDLIARYEASFDRQYYRALNRLTKLREKRDSSIQTQSQRRRNASFTTT